jgi:hypothetical protein
LTGFKENVAMTPSFKVGDLEINGYSDGILRTSLDLMVDMERARSTVLVGATDNGWLCSSRSTISPSSATARRS